MFEANFVESDEKEDVKDAIDEIQNVKGETDDMQHLLPHAQMIKVPRYVDWCAVQEPGGVEEDLVELDHGEPFVSFRVGRLLLYRLITARMLMLRAALCRSWWWRGVDPNTTHSAADLWVAFFSIPSSR